MLYKMEDYILTRRDFSKALITTSLATLVGCDGDEERINKIPNVSIVRDFNKNNGEVNYTLIGEDIDGNITEIQTKYNDEREEAHKGSNITFSKIITKQTNTLEAIAIDNENASSARIIDKFDIPDRKEVYDLIKSLLDNNGNFAEYASNPAEKLPIFLDVTPYLVDFIIIRNDGRTSTISYTSVEDNLKDELSNQGALTDSFVDNIYVHRLPKEEIEKRVKEFISVGYLTDFENQ